MISVIVPVYNVEKYLNRCVESILAQSYIDFELILVDDGSPDMCGEICDDYAQVDSRIIVIHQKNQGLSAARNSGLKVMRGTYVTFIDSDDVVHPQYLEKLYETMIRNDSDISVCDFKRFSELSEINNDKIMDEKKVYHYGNVEVLRKYFDRNIQTSRYVSACWKLYKRELFSEIRFPVGRLFEDEYVTYKLFFKAKNVSVIDSYLYYYFVNDTGITCNLNLRKRFDEYDAQYERLLFFKEHELNDLYQMSILEFLRSAQWDLIQCRKNTDQDIIIKKKNFEKQYKMAFTMAKKERVIKFNDHYDYYILANPQYTQLYRIKRIFSRFITKNQK